MDPDRPVVERRSAKLRPPLNTRAPSCLMEGCVVQAKLEEVDTGMQLGHALADTLGAFTLSGRTLRARMQSM